MQTSEGDVEHMEQLLIKYVIATVGNRCFSPVLEVIKKFIERRLTIGIVNDK